jgi:AmiR/NasT family two-component response regulator
LAQRAEDSEKQSKTLHRIFQFLYLQFAFYWATIAAGMLVNYYYAVPADLQANFSSIFLQFFAAPSLFAHVTFAVLSTGMSIPVIILTTSKVEEDIIRTYNLHANCYITKPVDLDQFLDVVRTIEEFWLTIVKLPSGRG